ncbi:unnamed protein product, partial [Rodentolepis nana]|uniref:Secreted protein n=1 Tax=Rodentolepis nana TaxID=102285 RepID=A0A0R3TG48_RODNA
YLWVSVVVFGTGRRVRCFARQSYPVRSLNSATTSILAQSAMSESATVHCFSFLRALSFHCPLFLLCSSFDNGFDSRQPGMSESATVHYFSSIRRVPLGLEFSPD